MGQGKWLTFEERVLIEHYWNDEQLSTSEIARRLGRNQSSIWRELRRGSKSDLSNLPDKFIVKNKRACIHYSADIGQQRRLSNHVAHEGPYNLTYDLKKDIEFYLNEKGWSPEDYTAKFPNCGVSARTIRHYIKKGYLDIKQKSYGHGSRRKRQMNEEQKAQLKLKQVLAKEFAVNNENTDMVSVNRVSLDYRPTSVENRRYFGHWEGDLVISRDGKRTPILVLVERKTRYVVILRTASKYAVDMIQAIDNFMLLHQDYVKSITFDNGIEFTSWEFLERIQVYYGKKTYFAHPSAPHERGTNETKNKFIRHYASYTDYDRRTQIYWDGIADLINDKPMRHALNGETPARAYHKEILQINRQKKHRESN